MTITTDDGFMMFTCDSAGDFDEHDFLEPDQKIDPDQEYLETISKLSLPAGTSFDKLRVSGSHNPSWS